MSNYDQATQNFMTTVANKPVAAAPIPEPEEADSYGRLKQLGFAIRSPLKALGSLAYKAFTKDVDDDGIQKTSGITTIGIYSFLNDNYKREWWDWEPETIWQTLSMDDIQVDEELKDTVLALQVCVTTMAPFEHWHIFENVGHAFNGNPVLFNMVQPLEPDECSLAHKILRLLQPKTEYESEILGYIAMCARNAGLVFLPEELFPKGCQKYLEDVTWDKDLIKRTRDTWYSDRKGDVPDDVAVQIGRLQDVKDYVRRLGA